MAGETPLPPAPEDTPGARDEAAAGGATPRLRPLGIWEKVEMVCEKLRENSVLVRRLREASNYRELVELTEELERRLGVKVFWNEHVCTADDDIVFTVNIREGSDITGWIVVCVLEGKDIEIEVSPGGWGL